MGILVAELLRINVELALMLLSLGRLHREVHGRAVSLRRIFRHLSLAHVVNLVALSRLCLEPLYHWRVHLLNCYETIILSESASTGRLVYVLLIVASPISRRSLTLTRILATVLLFGVVATFIVGGSSLIDT